jgi:HK97 family phage prohead protease
MLTQGFSYAHAAPVLFLKDIDATGRTVRFYGSAFDNLDSDGDIVIKGAYAKTIAENGPRGTGRIKHLRQHETRSIIGKITEMEEDSKGLLCTSILADNEGGNDALELYKLDLLEHSIGYRTVKQQYDQATGANYLQELALREVSAVTWGANGDTPLVGIKCDSAAGVQLSFARISEREAKLTKALRHGNISDTLGHQLADELDALQTAYKGLISLNGELLKPAPATSAAGEPSGEKALSQFLKLVTS